MRSRRPGTSIRQRLNSERQAVRKIDQTMRGHTRRGRATLARRCAVVLLCVTFALSGCSRAPLNPPRLVVSTDTDMAIQLFMQATIMLANYYGYDQIAYADVAARSRRAGLSTIPFMAPESVRATPDLVNLMNRFENDPTQLATIVQRVGGYKNLVKYYIRTGLRASQSICRSYLLDIDERSEYLEFIKSEIGVGYTLSTAVLTLVNANATLAKSFMIAQNGIDGALNVYEDYRYLSIDREAARALVEAAQNAYAQYFMQQVDATSRDNNLTTGGYTFSDALHAVSTIEYQCTRSGIKALLARSINNSPSNLMIDQMNGTISFISSKVTPVNNNPLGGVVNNGGPGGVVIPPGGGGGAVVIPGGGGGTTHPDQKRPPRQQDPGATAQLDPAVSQACATLPPNKTQTQIQLCETMRQRPELAGVAAVVLTDILRNTPTLLPGTTLLPEVINRNNQPPFETARASILRDPRMR
jgi:hypothetical protein